MLVVVDVAHGSLLVGCQRLIAHDAVVYAGRQCEVFNIVDSDYVVERVRIEVKRISVDACIGEAREVSVAHVVCIYVIVSDGSS